MAKWELQVEIDKLVAEILPVIAKGDKNLKTLMDSNLAKIGERVGTSADWATRPTVDSMGKPLSKNDTFRLETKDGTHPAGLYSRKADNSDWEDTPFLNFDDIGISQIIQDAKAGAGDIVIDPATGNTTATVDDKFTTPKEVGDALNAFRTATANLYHPKGGDANLKVVGKDADDDTQEFITANQSKVAYTEANLQAQYDTIYNA